MPFQIIRNDITQVKADVIVNTANPKPVIGSGTDHAIYAAAGMEKLLAKRKKIGDIAPGDAAVTPAFHLKAKHIIHTVGPVWVDGRHGEREILRACYANSLSLAAKLRAKSIAFPLIATGVYGFPKDEALNIALAEIGRFLLTHDIKVILVVFDRDAFKLSGELAGEIEAFIDDHGVAAAVRAEYGLMPDLPARRRAEYGFKADLPAERRAESGFRPHRPEQRRAEPEPATQRRAEDGFKPGLPAQSRAQSELPTPRRDQSVRREEEERRNWREDTFTEFSAIQEDASAEPDFSYPAMDGMAQPSMTMPSMAKHPMEDSLDDLLNHAGETFQQRLFHLIDASGMTDTAVYKKANIDRRVFSRIRGKKDYRPKKVTAVAFAIALELDWETMEDLLSRAGIAFSPSDRFDLIIQYFVRHHNYDIFEINAALFKYGQPILGEA